MNKKRKLSYDEWKKLVDRSIEGLTHGMDSEWIPDYDYYREYTAGTSPAVTATRALRAARNF